MGLRKTFISFFSLYDLLYLSNTLVLQQDLQSSLQLVCTYWSN